MRVEQGSAILLMKMNVLEKLRREIEKSEHLLTRSSLETDGWSDTVVSTAPILATF